VPTSETVSTSVPEIGVSRPRVSRRWVALLLIVVVLVVALALPQVNAGLGADPMTGT
jgi:hypothetical protein